MDKSAIHLRLTEAIEFSTEKLLQSHNWKENIPDVLEKLGESTGVSRVYIFENDYDAEDNLVMRQGFEWVNEGISKQLDNENLQELPYNISTELHSTLASRKPFKGLIKNMENPVKKILEDQEIVSILLTPIFIEEDWYGFIGFDDCIEEREWDKQSIDLLNIISNIIAAAIQKEKTQDNLKLSQQYFASLFDKAPEGIAIVNPEGIIDQVNDEFCKLFNYKRQEALGKNIDELILTPEYRKEAKELTHAAARGDRVSTEGVRYTKESVPTYVSIMGVPIEFRGEHKGIYVIYRDISERKLAEKNLQESQTKFKTLFDSSNDAIFLMKDDIFIDCNAAATKIFKASEEELVGESPMKFSPLYQPSGEESEKVIKEKVQKALQGDPISFDYTHITGEGKSFEAEISLSKVVLKESTFLQAILRDITERKKAEKELYEAKERAEESDRLKTAFLASMSHEIRTPMNHILGGLDLLLDPDITSDEKEEFHTIIKRSSNQLLNLIDDIIDVSQLDAGQVEIKKESFALREFLDEVEEEADKLGEESPNVEFQINTSAHQSELDSIFSDKVRLKQVLISLLSNAFKFTEEGNIELGYEKKTENSVQFYVSDTGIGIPEESKKVIFEQFRQVDYEHTREYEGAGLGLTLAKGMVELMGGEIWVDSEPGKGSTFYFTVSTKKPVQKEKPKSTSVSKQEKSTHDWQDKTILIVEDEEMNYQYLKTVLKKTKANLLWGENGLEGVKLARENDIHIVLMDIQMPEMNGYEATRQILEIKPETPIIAQTAHALKEEKSKCFEAGAVDYMSKPLNRKTLLQIIGNHIL